MAQERIIWSDTADRNSSISFSEYIILGHASNVAYWMPVVYYMYYTLAIWNPILASIPKLSDARGTWWMEGGSVHGVFSSWLVSGRRKRVCTSFCLVSHKLKNSFLLQKWEFCQFWVKSNSARFRSSSYNHSSNWSCSFLFFLIW